jgi:hypothetical protein
MKWRPNMNNFWEGVILGLVCGAGLAFSICFLALKRLLLIR